MDFVDVTVKKTYFCASSDYEDRNGVVRDFLFRIEIVVAVDATALFMDLIVL